MSYTFGALPTLGFALPFRNLSFGKWSGALPDQFAYLAGTPTGTHSEYNPGFDLSRACRITDTGVISSASNTLVQYIDLPSYIPNGQVTHVGAAVLSDLGGSYGSGKAVVKLIQVTTGDLASIYNENVASWAIIDGNSTAGINTANGDLGIKFEIRSYNSEADPAGLFDCLMAQHGRTAAERYYAFTHYPDLSGVEITPFTFSVDKRGAGGDLLSYDQTGGAVKWRIKFPFFNVPSAFVEVLNEFWAYSRGLYGPARPIVLTHNLVNVSAAHTTGQDFLHRPPWIICKIVNDELPFQTPAGQFLGADMFDGTLIFEEV